jgi:hypothetical protein
MAFAPPWFSSGRPRRCSAARRLQKQRSHGRAIGHLLGAVNALTSHRGAEPTRLARALAEALGRPLLAQGDPPVPLGAPPVEGDSISMDAGKYVDQAARRFGKPTMAKDADFELAMESAEFELATDAPTATVAADATAMATATKSLGAASSTRTSAFPSDAGMSLPPATHASGVAMAAGRAAMEVEEARAAEEAKAKKTPSTALAMESTSEAALAPPAAAVASVLEPGWWARALAGPSPPPQPLVAETARRPLGRG